MKNEFYLFTYCDEAQLMSQSYDIRDGHLKTESGVYGYPNQISVVSDKGIPVFRPISDYQYHSLQVIMFDSENNYLGYRVYQYGVWTNYGKMAMELIEGTAKIYFNVALYSESVPTTKSSWMKIGYSVKPHYKKLKKVYKKENGQAFFRESLEGVIKLFGSNYNLVKASTLENTLGFEIYRDKNVFVSASFNKSDCKFNHYRKSVELKLTYGDRYTKVLNAYDNTYDLMKLAPSITPLTLTKRCVVQIYVQGESVISNYAGGTYWETEVIEPVDDQNKLTTKYYFSKGPKFEEISLSGFNYDINAVYEGASTSDVWNSTSIRIIDGNKYRIPCSIKFNKVANAGERIIEETIPAVFLLSTGAGNGLRNVGSDENPEYAYAYDTYRIEIWTGLNGTGNKIYQSNFLYGKDNGFTLSNGGDLYLMTRVEQPSLYRIPEPATFHLGENVIEYQIWGRLICDSDTFNSLPTYDLPYDDFATARNNYRKCIGLTGFDESTSVVKIYQNQATSEKPTAYGINDFGEYFIAPYTIWGQYFFPLARNSWANTSLWVMLDETLYPNSGFEHWSSGCYREYTIRECYHIADVIKALLSQINPSITHEKSSDYSSFLYGHVGATASALGGCDIYITPKSNILKGEYDQAAQKAELKFKQLMDMLRDCFRCYWFIDEQNRLIIEHISYFLNGMSYATQDVQLDLTSEKDKFNKKPVLYDQQEIEYDKSELTSRYEFTWSDKSTKAMGGDLYIDVKNKYIQENKIEEINIDEFSSDIDYMLFLPEDFSSDGFALLLADSNRKVPIVHQRLKEEKQDNRLYDVSVQNWYASFNQLAHHYMNDMPGRLIEYNNIQNLQVNTLKRCVKHNIEFSLGTSDIEDLNVYRMISTDIGNGFIESVSIDVDTKLVEAEIRYEPS